MPGHSTEPFAGFVDSQRSAWINQPEGLTKVSGMFCSALSRSVLCLRKLRHVVQGRTH